MSGAFSPDSVSQTYGLRFFNVFGPRERAKGLQASVLHQNKEKLDESPVRLFRNSNLVDYPEEASRDFVGVDYVIKVIRGLINGDVRSSIYNVGIGEAVKFSDLFKSASKIAGKNSNIEYIPIPSDLISRYQFFTKSDNSKIFEQMPYLSNHSLFDSIAYFLGK